MAGEKSGHENIKIANEVRLWQSARRAIDDPAVLARAARIVRVALARELLTPEDLEPHPVEDAKASS